MPKLSIIIPHYQATASLERLLTSIPDTPAIQVIVVDDHSDACHRRALADIRDRHAAKSLHIYTNAPSKKGAGACRNIGLKHARGEWLLFADADDYFLDGFYDVVNMYEDSSADVIFFPPTSVDETTGKAADRHHHFAQLVTDAVAAPDSGRCVRALKYHFIVPWSKLYRTAFIRAKQIRFDEVIAANDVMFATKAGYYLERLSVSEAAIYCVTTTPGSLTMTVDDHILDARVEVFIRQYQFLQNRLSEKAFQQLALSGRPLLRKAFHASVEKMFQVYKTLRKHRVRVLEPKLFHPLWLGKTAFTLWNKYRREKHYYEYRG